MRWRLACERRQLATTDLLGRVDQRKAGNVNIVKRRIMWMFGLASVLAACLTGLVGCGDGIDVIQWTEDVKMHDGKVVVLERRARAYKWGFPTAHRGAMIDQELWYRPMGIYWKSTLDGQFSGGPASFELFGGSAYLITIGQSREFCRGKSPATYVAQVWRWENTQWQVVPSASIPFELAVVNVGSSFFNAGSTDLDYRGHIKWDDKPPGYRNGTVKELLEQGSTCKNLICPGQQCKTEQGVLVW